MLNQMLQVQQLHQDHNLMHIEGYLVQNHDLIREAIIKAKSNSLKVSLDLASFNVVEDNLFDAIHSNPGYVGIMAPRTTNVRYITEDVPMSLVPISEVGSKTNVDTPVIDSLIHIADSIFDKDFRNMGRNLESMGMTDLGLEEVRKLLINGKK